jgi:DNA-binding transcriptional regulator YhcF (GntR family)
VFQAIDQRFDIERQLVRTICYEIARGAWSAGDSIPSPHAFAHERILNPRVVESAYATLVENGVLTATSGDQYEPAEDAPARARACLLQWAKEDVKDLVSALRRVGVAALDIQSVLGEITDA